MLQLQEVGKNKENSEPDKFSDPPIFLWSSNIIASHLKEAQNKDGLWRIISLALEDGKEKCQVVAFPPN